MITKEFQECIDACDICATECNHCASSCLQEKEVKMLAKCIQLNTDCASICRMAVQLMASKSDFSMRICQLCAEICNACANECEKHSHMEHCAVCAQACRKCAEACNAMSGRASA